MNNSLKHKKVQKVEKKIAELNNKLNAVTRELI
jgi:hypothetical protein